MNGRFELGGDETAVSFHPQAVHNAEHMDTMNEYLHELGSKHVKFGATVDLFEVRKGGAAPINSHSFTHGPEKGTRDIFTPDPR